MIILKETPILFSGPMIKALLSGRKTQTRRIIRPQPGKDTDVYYMPNPPLCWQGEWRPWKWDTEEGESISKHCPFGQIGDLLWVREAWANCYNLLTNPFETFFLYKADGTANVHRWKPSIHMPKHVARIWLRVNSIRTEQLQEISENDALEEGVNYFDHFYIGRFFKNYTANRAEYGPNPEEDYPTVSTAKESFQTLWESIHGVGSWSENPWVWVIQFDLISKTGKP